MPWLLSGMLLGALAVTLVCLISARFAAPSGIVDAGSYEEFREAGEFPPVLFERDEFYITRDENGEPKALYVYPPPAQVHNRPDCAVLWQLPMPDGTRMDTLRDRCYGATFTRDGAWISGPSSRPLDQFRVQVKDGRLLVDVRHLICTGPGPCKKL